MLTTTDLLSAPQARKELRIDLETYSSVDIKSSGAYKYVASDDFEILIFCYAIDEGEKVVIDMAGELEDIPDEIIEMLTNPLVTKKAYNANFERLALGKHLGYVMPPDQWECTAVKGSRHGLPGNLDQLSKAMKLQEQKDAKGKALIKYFSMPCKPTKVNGMRRRNLPYHDPEKWEQYKEYCRQDVITEHQVDMTLQQNPITGAEQQLWVVDQLINDKGIAVDMELVDQALRFDELYSQDLEKEMIEITGIANPNSVQQLTAWLSDEANVQIESLTKDVVLAKIEYLKDAIKQMESGDYQTVIKSLYNLTANAMMGYFPDFGAEIIKVREEIRQNASSPIEGFTEWVEINIMSDEKLGGIFRDLIDIKKLEKAVRVLELRLELAKSSIKKYNAIEQAAIPHEGSTRVHGLLQFYGANRTGRWAGRLVQVQNLARNYISGLDDARQIVKKGEYDMLPLIYGSISEVLSQLIRTAFVPTSPEHVLRICDYSAIEARVLAWLSNEKWRLEVFSGHGKIYEASAAMMFGVDLDTIVKGHENYKLRSQGKVAELALGYGGGVAAIEVMDSKKAIPPEEREPIRNKWRQANPAIVKFWKSVGDACMNAIKTGNIIELQHGLQFYTRDEYLFIVLPNGRKLAYYGAYIEENGNRFGGDEVRYYGIDDRKQWTRISSYGPKFVENIVQAISRDCLGVALMRLHQEGFNPVMHVHDEVVCDELKESDKTLELMSEIMAKPIPWAPGLYLPAEGYESEYYKKED